MAQIEQILALVGQYLDPYLKQSYVELGWAKMVGDTLRIRLGYPAVKSQLEEIQSKIGALLAKEGIQIPVEVRVKIARHKVQDGVKPQMGIKNVIAIGSGKGGVGKSTLAANLAISLSKLGCKVGLLDADIYGPSQPAILGVEQKPEVKDKRFIPIKAHGISMLSMGNLVDESQAMIWRGPMVSGALLQLFGETQWDELDYLLLDLPPGTGDIQLTMAQKLPISGAVVVTTPQDLSLLDAGKAISMFEKVKIPVLGIIENMSTFVCPNCEHEEHLFGHEGAQRLALKRGVSLLGEIPLARAISEESTKGTPIVTQGDSKYAQAFSDAALRISAALATKATEFQLNIQTKANV